LIADLYARRQELAYRPRLPRTAGTPRLGNCRK